MPPRGKQAKRGAIERESKKARAGQKIFRRCDSAKRWCGVHTSLFAIVYR